MRISWGAEVLAACRVRGRRASPSVPRQFFFAFIRRRRSLPLTANLPGSANFLYQVDAIISHAINSQSRRGALRFECTSGRRWKDRAQLLLRACPRGWSSEGALDAVHVLGCGPGARSLPRSLPAAASRDLTWKYSCPLPPAQPQLCHTPSSRPQALRKRCGWPTLTAF